MNEIIVVPETVSAAELPPSVMPAGLALDWPALPLVPASPVAAITTVPVAAAPSLTGAPAVPVGPWGMIGSLLLVLGLILVLGRGLKGLQAGRQPGGEALRLRGSLALGGREKLVWVQAGETHLLLGVGAGPVSNLHVFDIPPDFDQPAARSPNSADFAHKLRLVLDRARRRSASPAPVAAPAAAAPVAAASTPAPAAPMPPPMATVPRAPAPAPAAVPRFRSAA